MEIPEEEVVSLHNDGMQWLEQRMVPKPKSRGRGPKREETRSYHRLQDTKIPYSKVLRIKSLTNKERHAK